jgi:4-carboxymuconolactone decarboxylase
VVVADHEDTLRKLAIRDDALVDLLTGDIRANLAASRLGESTHALVQLGALIAVDAAPPSYMEVIDSARRCDTPVDEIVGVLIAVMPAIGVARVVSAAPKLGLALGYDVGSALEERV